MNPTNYYGHFRVWLLRARTGDANAATEELASYLDTRARSESSGWELKIGTFLCGRIDEAEFLKSAHNSDPKKEADQLCEAYYYAASKRLLAGDSGGAADLFQRSLDTEKREYMEYASATAELKFLKFGAK